MPLWESGTCHKDACPGEGEDWFKGWTIAPGGKMPVNTIGGMLSEAYYMGFTTLSEGTLHIMGRCREQQRGPQTGAMDYDASNRPNSVKASLN